MSKKTTCIYCSLPLRGKGCAYSPNGVHIHPAKNNCMYCGHNLKGPGCQYSPTGIHTPYIQFGAIQAEQLENHLITAYILEKMSAPMTSLPAYQMGIINEQGHKIKDPTTLQEHRSYGVLDRYIIRLKRMIGSKIDSINEQQYIDFIADEIKNKNLITEDWDEIDYREKVIAKKEITNKLECLLNEYYNILKEGEQRLSINEIDDIFSELLFKKHNNATPQ